MANLQQYAAMPLWRRQVANRIGSIVTPQMFGAKGDGTTDDTEALQAAINAVQATKGRVFIPDGIYLTDGLTIGTEGQRYTAEIIGEGWNGDIGQANTGGVTLLLASAANVSLFTVASTAAPCAFENLNMQGQKSTQTGITQGGSDRSYGVWFVDYTTDATKQRSGRFTNCRIEDFASGGVRVGLLRNAGIFDGKTTILNNGRKETGTATAGAASTITLAVVSSAVDSFYNNMPILISAGTGVGQMRTISGYVGSTRVATVSVAWEIQPVNGTSYQIGLVLGDGVVFGSCNDWRCSGIDVGGNTRNGFYHTGAGSITYHGACNTFTNWSNGLQRDDTALDMQYIGGSIDTNYGYGAWLRGSSSDKYNASFDTVRFNQNGIGAHNTFADVKVSDDDNVSLVNCTSLKGSSAATNDRYPKYFLETTGTTARVLVADFNWDTANLPWTTSRFSSESVIVGLCEAGTYTPTYTNVNNISAKTTFDLRYSRNGPHVSVFGRMIVTPTAAAPTQTIVGISLPIASNFANIHDCAGASACDGLNQSGVVNADTGNDRAQLVYMAQDTTNRSQYFNFQYAILA